MAQVVVSNPEYVWPIMDEEEFSMRSMLGTECDDEMIRELKQVAFSEWDTDTQSSSFSDTDDSLFEIDDDLSLDEKSYLRRGMRSSNLDEFCGDDDETKSVQRTVRFSADSSNDVVCQKYENMAPLDKKYKKSTWYRKTDFKKFRIEVAKEAAAARKTQYSRDFKKIFDSCSSSKTLRLITQKQTSALADSKYRGYEPAIFYTTLSKERKEIVKKVLKTQQHYKSCGTLISPEERALEVCEVSRQLTKPFRRLGSVLGSADAVEARKYVNRQEMDQLFKQTVVYRRRVHRHPSPRITENSEGMVEI